RKTCKFLCNSCNCYILPWFVWVNILCCRTTEKRNWCKKSIGCICFQCLEFTLKRFFVACNYFIFCSNTACLLFHVQLASELYLPYRNVVVDLRCCRYWLGSNYHIGCKFSSYKSCNSQSCKEFE